MSNLQKWEDLKRKRNLCASATFTIGVLGLIGVISQIKKLDFNNISLGEWIGLLAYIVIIIIGLILTIFYELRFRRLTRRLY